MATFGGAEELRRLVSTCETPVVLHKVIDSWPFLKYSLGDWQTLFATRPLECRAGSRRGSGAPQWERDCRSVRCTFEQFVNWSQGKEGAGAGGQSCDSNRVCESNQDDVGDGNSSYLLQTSVENSDRPESVAGVLGELDPSENFLYFDYKYMKDMFAESVLASVDWSCAGFPHVSGSESTFWFGSAGAHTPCHYDTYGVNLVAQLYGRKRWVLFPPGDTDVLAPTRVPYEESSVYSDIDLHEWDDQQVRLCGNRYDKWASAVAG